MKGNKHIPLNRLSELPQDIVEEIEPVFFNEERWKLEADYLYIWNYKQNEYAKYIQFDKEQHFIFQSFMQKITLKEISKSIENKFGIDYNNAFNRVSALFFKLASVRLCHPLQMYDIDELIKIKEPEI